jgi:putative hydrolase of the HAD superfamily
MLNPTQVRIVTFDVGGTLIDPFPSVGEVYAAAARESNFPCPQPDELTATFSKVWKNKEGFDYSFKAWAALVDEVFGTALPRNVFQAMYDRFKKADAWMIYPDVRPTLEALRDCNYRMAVISNWDDRLPPLLDALGLGEFFEAVVLSVHTRATKPSPEMYKRALSTLNITGSEVLHIGDSQEEDVRGAQAVGMQALLLDRKGYGNNSIRALDGILPLLDRSG